MSDGIKRRDFLKVLGAGSAGAATVGCSTGEVERLIPYVIPPEEIVPGVPTWYATTCRECPAGCGLHVETHSGRTTKVEGNPAHPISRGNTCARGQASVQGLYHPDRHQGPRTVEPGVGSTDVTWGVAERLLADRIREIQGAGGAGRIVFLTQEYTGTMDRLVDDWVASIGARRVVYDVWRDQPHGLSFADADVLVSFGADFLETWGSPVEYAGQFAQMHSYRQGRRGKFVWIAPHRPLTGLNADQWIAPRPGTEAVLAQALAGGVDAAAAARETGVEQAVIEELVREFRAGNGVALGPGPAIAGANASDLRDAIDGLNAGRAGTQPTRARGVGREMIRLVEQMRRGEIEMLLVDAPNPVYTLPGGLEFGEAMRNVRTRVSFSTFPDETSALCTMILPDHHFLEKWDDHSPRPGVVSLVQPTMRPVFNTKQVGDVLLSVAAQLGSAAVSEGVEGTTWYDYLRASWGGAAEGQAWRDAVVRGGVFPAAEAEGAGAAGIMPLGAVATPGAGPQPAGARAGVAPVAATGQDTVPTPFGAPAVQAPVRPEPAPGGIRAAAAAFEGSEDASFHLVVYPSYRFYHGSTANRPWLLELPDPVTKVSWQSWVEVHPDSAREMGVEQGDWVEVTSPYGSVRTPVYVYPGVRPDTVAIQTGLGHTALGRYTEGRGVNPNQLLGAAIDQRSGEFAPYSVRVSLRKIGDNIAFEEKLFEQGVRVQYDREMAQALSVAELAHLEETVHPIIPGEDQEIETLRTFGGFGTAKERTDPAAYPQPGTRYGEYIEGIQRWAMAIDLSRCIGCSACVVACNAENNIPVVGPKEMRRGRELHWLRIERYFGVTSHEEEAYDPHATDDVRFLPMLCQHCGNAPCEPVCPVYAAYHTPDGLNGQVYNRCVGTRYCANNCPYKVRVFNWFTYDFAEPLNWQLNPDVSVREKGVMEKCTFCVQRIREKEQSADRDNRAVADGEVVPACAQACPTEVFVFGNIADPDSQVAQAARSVRGYRVLDLLNTQPAVVYLKKVTLEEPARGGHAAPAAGGEHAAPAAGH